MQQWFGYCTNAKKQSCPVCKQGCSDKNVGRLYFQSIGDPIVSQSQIGSDNRDKNGDDECPELLRREVKRLEAKVSGLNSVLEVHQKDVKQLSDEVIFITFSVFLIVLSQKKFELYKFRRA